MLAIFHEEPVFFNIFISIAKPYIHFKVKTVAHLFKFNRMSFELEGILHKKFDTEQIKDTFRKRELVVETQGQYPQLIKFELVQDRCELLDKYEENQPIKVHFDLRGREWNGKYFVNLNAWRLEQPQASAGGGNPGANANPSNTPPPPPPPAEGTSEDGDGMEDLPF